jgi:apolipoprotein N-acyltransferase
MLGLAGLWIGLEALRGWALTGFGWLPLAASQVSNPVMLSLCEVTGQLGLSGAVILGNLAVARWIRRQIVERKDLTGPKNILTGLTPEIYLGFAPVALAFAIHVDFSLGLVHSANTTRVLRVAAVQTDIDPNAKWDSGSLSEQLESLRELTRDAGRTKPDFILLPEAAIAVLPLRHPGYLATLKDLSRETGCPIVLGALEERKEEYANSIAAVGPEGVIGLPYAKRHLVPFGEYVPLADWLPLRKVVPISRDCLRGMSATPILLSTRAGDTVVLGPLVCYEDVFPELARDHALAGADVLVVLTNDAWYGRELGAWQHAAHSALLAAATRLPVVRCGNAGWSGSMDTLGRSTPVLHEGTIYFQGGRELPSVSYDTQRREMPTFWVRHGDWITPPAIALFALAVLVRRRLKISPASTQTLS